jgi:hypothetical protein
VGDKLLLLWLRGRVVVSLALLITLPGAAPLLQGASLPSIPEWVYGPFALTVAALLALWGRLKEKPLWYDAPTFIAKADECEGWKQMALSYLKTQGATVDALEGSNEVSKQMLTAIAEIKSLIEHGPPGNRRAAPRRPAGSNSGGAPPR